MQPANPSCIWPLCGLGVLRVDNPAYAAHHTLPSTTSTLAHSRRGQPESEPGRPGEQRPRLGVPVAARLAPASSNHKVLVLPGTLCLCMLTSSGL